MKNITDYLEREQVDQILGFASKVNFRDYLIIRVLWRTGVRLNELINIKPSDIEWANLIVNITKGKRGKQRRVLLDDNTLKMLSDYISEHNTSDNQPVFALKHRQIENIVKKYGRMIGVDIHPHTLRHSFAIHLVRSGMDLRRLQLLLGHSSLNMTQIYLQFKDDDIREIYQKIDF
ncbi:MAG: tyrosine-type recombinase/integrase [Halobacteriota archaeon]